MKYVILCLALIWLGLVPVQAAEDGVIVRLAKVYPKANTRDKAIGQIEAGSSVNVFERSGGWKHIFSEERAITGWIRSYQVREGLNAPEIKEEPDSRGFLSGLASFSRKASSFFGGDDNPSGGSTRTATIGVRGLSEEQIKNAKPDLVQLEKMQGFGSNKSRMASFVSAGELSAVKVKHLKKKKK